MTDRWYSNHTPTFRIGRASREDSWPTFARRGISLSGVRQAAITLDGSEPLPCGEDAQCPPELLSAIGEKYLQFFLYP